MPVLENQRHELFCQAIAKGETTSKAYELAGFRPSRSNAARLRADERIAERLSEIRGAAAASAKVTIESLLGELEDARARATSLNQLNAAVRASVEKGRLAGLLIERAQIEVAQSEITEEMSVAEILQKVAAHDGLEAAILLARLFECEAELTQEILAAAPLIDQKLDHVRQQLAAGASVASAQRSIEDWRPPRPGYCKRDIS